MRYIVMLLLLKLFLLSGCGESSNALEINFERNAVEGASVNFMPYTEYESTQNRREIAGDIIFWSDNELSLVENRDEFLLLCNDTAVALYLAMYNLLYNTDPIFIEAPGDDNTVDVKLYRKIDNELAGLLEEVGSDLLLIFE